VDEQVVEVLTTPKKSVVRKKLTQKKSCDAMTLCICFYFRPCITFFVWTMYYYLCLDHVLLSMFGPYISFYVWTMYQLRYQFMFCCAICSVCVEQFLCSVHTSSGCNIFKLIDISSVHTSSSCNIFKFIDTSSVHISLGCNIFKCTIQHQLWT
jgi:hypothetical protein